RGAYMQQYIQVRQGYEDMTAKQLVWGAGLGRAIARAKLARSECVVRGVYTTIPARFAVLSHPDFLTANHHTRWLEESIELVEEALMAPPSLPEEEALQQRTMTVEIGGRRFSVTFLTP